MRKIKQCCCCCQNLLPWRKSHNELSCSYIHGVCIWQYAVQMNKHIIEWNTKLLYCKVAKHSFCACSCWCNSAHIQKQTCHWYSDHFDCSMHTAMFVIFRNWTQYVDGFSLLLQRYVRKGINSQNLNSNSPIFLCYLKNPVK